MISLLIANQVHEQLPVELPVENSQMLHFNDYYQNNPPPAPETIKKSKKNKKKKASKTVISADVITKIKKKKIRKYGFRSKQIMINKVYSNLCTKYEKLGILARKDEVLRGEDTVRLHVKKFKALQRIEAALETLEHVNFLKIQRISLPLSMKNQFQKKGFLVYVQLKDAWMAEAAQVVFRKFDEFRKCHVARVSEAVTSANDASESCESTGDVSESVSSEKLSAERESTPFKVDTPPESPSNGSHKIKPLHNLEKPFTKKSPRFETYEYPENVPIATFGRSVFQNLEFEEEFSGAQMREPPMGHIDYRANSCPGSPAYYSSTRAETCPWFEADARLDDEAHLWDLLPWAEESELW